MAYVLALDQGTTSSRAIVFDGDSRAVAVSQREFQQHFPRPDRVEHDPEDLIETQRACAVEALAEAGLRPSDIAGIGITNQRETTVVWDRATGRAIHPAIVWQDRRTAAVCAELRAAGHEDLVRRKTGLVLDPYFSGTKAAWILDEVPGARERAEAGELAFGTVDSWLAWRLTGGQLHVTDATNASRTMLFDLASGDWDDELSELLRVPKAMLPRVVASSEVLGEASAEGLEGIPLAALVGDQQAALVGQAGWSAGAAKNTYGTGCFLLRNTGEEPRPSTQGLLTTVAARLGERTTFALEGSVFIGGAIVQWLRDGLGVIDRSVDVEGLAASVDDTGGVVLVPALTGLGAPHWDPHARGLLIGMTRGTTAGHVARAALLGMANSVADLLGAMDVDAGGAGLTELRVDGGAAANDLLLQMQADLLQVPVLRPSVLETTALGAAFLAGLATGVFASVEEVEAKWSLDARFEPAMPESEARRHRERFAEAVERCKGWATESADGEADA